MLVQNGKHGAPTVSRRDAAQQCLQWCETAALLKTRESVAVKDLDSYLDRAKIPGTSAVMLEVKRAGEARASLWARMMAGNMQCAKLVDDAKQALQAKPLGERVADKWVVSMRTALKGVDEALTKQRECYSDAATRLDAEAAQLEEDISQLLVGDQPSPSHLSQRSGSVDASPRHAVSGEGTPQEVTAVDLFLRQHGATGGWSPEDHAAFLRAYGDGGKDTETVLRAVRAALPHIAMEDVETHIAFHTAYLALLAKKRECIAAWNSKKAADEANGAFIAKSRWEREEAERMAIERSKQEKVAKFRESQKSRLQKWKEEKAAAEEERRRREEEAAAQHRRKQQEEREKQERRRAELAERKQQQEDERRWRRQLAEVEGNIRRKEMTLNQEEQLEKLWARDACIAAKRREAAVKKREGGKRVLPASPRPTTAECDFNRLIQPTMASTHRVHPTTHVDPTATDAVLTRGVSYKSPTPVHIPSRHHPGWCAPNHLF
eukprot:Sspe_Gene.78473::Locus_49085_Transcript_1_1_Confidence_1.000_Length_4036::g.78473::m.78473